MLPRGDQWWENNGGNTLWGSSWGWRRTTSSAGAHTHTVNVNGTSSNSGSGTAFSVKNPYYALIYCVKCR